MIPVRLALENFLSYADAEIDFTTFDIACLTGTNGAGKSALLDAITWALFGEARSGSRNHDWLVREGATQMTVDLTFDLDDHRYNIVRKRKRDGAGELLFRDRIDDGWRNLAAETTTQTQAKIERYLRMSYDTFTASAFFVQGRAENFMARTPAQRREIFADLLDLGSYELLADAARDHVKQRKTRIEEIGRRLESLASAPADLETAAAEHAAATALVAGAQGTVAAAKKAADAAREQVAELEKAQAVLDAQRSNLSALQATQRDLTTANETRVRTLAEIDELLARKDEVDEALKEAAALREASAAARADKDRAAVLERSCVELAGRIDSERATIVARHRERTAALASAQKESTEIAKHVTTLQQVDETLRDAGDPEAETAAVRALITDNEKADARLEEQLRSLDVRLSEITERASLLASGGGECPICGTALDASHRAKAKKLLTAERTAVTKERDAAKAERETVRKEIKRHAEDFKRLRAAAKDHADLLAAAADLRARVERGPEVRSTLVRLQEEIAADDALLAGDAFAVELLAELATLQQQRDTAYDVQAHERIDARRGELRGYEELAGRITAATDHRAATMRELETDRERLASLERDIAAADAEIAELAERAAPLVQATATAAEADRAHASAQEELTAATHTAAVLGERVQQLRTQVAEQREVLGEAERAGAEMRRYERLAQAFGRTGIPQLVIENERPLLTDEANRILGALTGDEMTLDFVFQGETKAGKPRETLEVLVRPLDGEPREFAMFSGGEAFRIAFAIRLALSKLLVRRAGARLETLVMDEGFGSQDAEGRQRLVEAIELARGEFRKILVITHLDEIKDRFGTQIRVSRDRERGSVIAVGG